ncbi:fcf2 pre-rRNA processing domain-containing protein [Ditylenchus destructor]|uniref:Fcf2 pre-rRNA processing domain-containing protein n=1 Tax=Ditylenchus destructor TaxID=166010 RepID=A0AAD4N9R3_9BILA|nr:fcf2 pre-rRNA processing domain-containing protein [Ditylenchus destructor]
MPSIRPIKTLSDVSSSSSSSDTDSDAEVASKPHKKTVNEVQHISFRCRPKISLQKAQNTEDSFFFIDTAGGDPNEAERPAETPVIEETETDKKEKAIISKKAEIIVDPKIEKILEKAVIKSGFDNLSVEEAALKSKNRQKKDRKIEREKTKGKDWFDMPATELTDERRHDLELLQMRDTLDPKTHYRRPDREVLPKYFEVGRVIESKYDYYSSRMTKKERKRTMVEEIMHDHEIIAKNKRRYEEIMRRKAITRPGAFQRKRFISKSSIRKKRIAKKK